jgi:hypothetical protein
MPGTPAANDATCDGIDDDCSGQADEDYVSTPTNCGVGACASTGQMQCVGGLVTETCTPGTPAADDSLCNGIDDDCNGTADEDYVSMPTTCGIGACASTGSTSCVSGAVVDSCTPGTPAPSDSTCNNVDDDCNGQVDEDVTAPSGSPALRVEKTLLSWNSIADATGYDIIRGSMGTLQQTSGDFATSTEECLANDLPDTSLPYTATPTPGQGFWFLTRSMNCGGNGSYDSGASSQVGKRDAEIAASASACP